MKSQTLQLNNYAALSGSERRKPVGETIPVFAKWLGSWQISIQRRALSESELARRYNQSSRNWQRTVERLGFPAVYQSLLSLAVWRDSPSHVLDCGVGTGALSQALLEVAEAPLSLSAVDLSPHMLERAKQVLSKTKARTNFYQANVKELPFADNSFDLVMTAHMLEHLPDPSDALREMARVLKPGGTLFACITRRSLASLMIHLKWRTHRMTALEAARLFQDAGLLGVENLAIKQAPWCQSLSLACIGRKPL